MTFSLSDVISGGATSSIMTNPITAHAAALSTLTSGIPPLSDSLGMNTALTGLNSMIASATSFMASEMESLKTRLPFMSAADSLAKTAIGLSGVSPGTNASSGLAAATRSITEMGPLVANAVTSFSGHFSNIGSALSSAGISGSTPQAQLANFSAMVPPATILDPTTHLQVTNPAYTSFMSAHAATLGSLSTVSSDMGTSASTVTSSITSMQSDAASATSAGASSLKDLAFAKFAMRPQPPAVQNILNQFVSTPGAQAQVESDILKGRSIVQNAQTASASSVAPNDSAVSSQTADPSISPNAPPTSDTTNITPTSSASYKATLATEKAQVDDIYNQWRSHIAICKSWQVSNNWAAVKKDATDNPTDQVKQDALTALRNLMHSQPDYIAAVALEIPSQQANARYQQDLDAYNKVVDGDYSGLIASTIAIGAFVIACLKRA